MIAMISPSLTSVENTLNTLRYADRVKELVAKDDDFVDYDMPTADEEKSCEMEDDMQESSGFKDETESDTEDSDAELPDEPNGFVDFNSSQTSECQSSLNKCDSYQNISSEVDPQSFQLTDVIMQHDVLFEYVSSFNKDFEKIATEPPSVKNIRLTKFLLESESQLRELEGIVKHTYNMVANFNSQQYQVCGGEDPIEGNVEM